MVARVVFLSIFSTYVVDYETFLGRHTLYKRQSDDCVLLLVWLYHLIIDVSAYLVVCVFPVLSSIVRL